MICISCGRRGHQSYNCPLNARSGAAPKPTAPMPTALSNDQIEKLAFKAKEGRQLHRGDVEALCAMAKERNALIAARPMQTQEQIPGMMLAGHP